MKLIRIHCHTDVEEKVTAYSLEYHPDILAIYQELGIIDLDEEETIHYEDMRRLNKIQRLKKNCGVNTIGATIIVDLLDQIENLQDEIERLRKKVGD